MSNTSFSAGQLLVRGSINIDEFFNVPHIVRSGETISSTGYSKRAGGKGANQAVSAAMAGARVDFAGSIGEDGIWLKDTLTGFGVNIDHLAVDSSLPTGRALIQLSSSTSDNSIVLLKGSNFSTTEPSATLSSYTHLLLQNEIPLDATTNLCTAAHSAGVHTLWNPSPMPTAAELAAFPFASLTWLLLNEGEAQDLLEIFGKRLDANGPEETIKALGQVERMSGVGLVMTLGAEGVMATAGEAIVRVGAGRLEGKVVDTTGAGDCFTGYFGTLLSQLTPNRQPTSQELESILSVACQAAAICVESEGAMESVPSIAQVRGRMGAKWPVAESWGAIGRA